MCVWGGDWWSGDGATILTPCCLSQVDDSVGSGEPLFRFFPPASLRGVSSGRNGASHFLPFACHHSAVAPARGRRGRRGRGATCRILREVGCYPTALEICRSARWRWLSGAAVPAGGCLLRILLGAWVMAALASFPVVPWSRWYRTTAVSVCLFGQMREVALCGPPQLQQCGGSVEVQDVAECEPPHFPHLSRLVQVLDT